MKVTKFRNELNKILTKFDPEVEIFMYDSNEDIIAEPKIFIQSRPLLSSSVRILVLKGDKVE